ncbi:MAG TPA: hypothetical protein VJ860_06515 [Polyangia bacterium]|jgi:hypothetical protein|nr:hypothetical protein [Polyangia bacterium]
MSLKRMSRAQLPRSTGPALVLLLGFGGAVGCSAYSTFRDVPINCKVEGEYDFDPVAATFDCYFDHTPDGGGQLNPIPGQGPCGDPSALILASSHNNDWGSTCNGRTFGPLDRSMYEGLSFWARAPGATSKGFTLSLYDANNTAAADPNNPNAPGSGHCKNYNAADGGLGGSIINAATDPATGQVISGAAIASRQPDECGNLKTNSYDFVIAVTSEWALYPIPWAKFTQAAYPNRVPNSVLTETGNVPGTGLLTTELYSLGIRPPKEAPFELWIDKLSFYRKKGHGSDAGPNAPVAGADAGPDAPATGAEAGPDAPAAGADAEPDVAAADADVDAEPDAAQI